MAKKITNNDDVIDSRDVIARIEELQGQYIEGADLTEDERRELDTLCALAHEGRNLADWEHGETLIRDSHFADYAKELATDLGAVSPDAKWPLMHIDWGAAAEALLPDYTDVTFDGVTYWAR